MCLIIVKPSGVDLPSKKVIKQAFSNNDDGMGVAWTFPNESVVHIRKGAMSFKQAKKLLRSLGDVKKADVLIHFRTATEGKVCKENCHPYPISNDDKKLKALELTCEVAVAHNGCIFNIDDDESGDGIVYRGYAASWASVVDLTQEETDTQRFIKKYLVGMGQAIFNKQVAMMIGGYTNSKFVILSPTQTITIGEFIERDGCFYSNVTYKPLAATETEVENKDFSMAGLEDGLVVYYGQKLCDNCGDIVYKTFHSVELGMYLCAQCKNFYIDPTFKHPYHDYNAP